VKKFLLLLVTLVISSFFYFSGQKSNPTLHFYHWKQTYKVASIEQPRYIKVLDIAYSHKLEIHKTKFRTIPSQKIVPVIYIDNPVFQKNRTTDLSTQLNSLLTIMAKNTFEFDEVQIDCDWSKSTKKDYFNFLKTFKILSGKTISTTIRLHQVKYHKRTGVPPVDKGALMYYNMANFKDLETKNYILDLQLAQKYHHNFESYPLPLDLALPLYAQASIIRFASVVGIIEGVRKTDLNENFKALENNHYEVTKTHYFKKRLLYEGDKIRVDEVSINDLQKAIQNLKKVMKKPNEIIFYRWGNRSEYEAKTLRESLTW